MQTIERGDMVLARTATNEWVRRRALTGPVQGMDFPVVWVCREEDWSRAASTPTKEVGVPWPADEVRPSAEG
jgi:hypothetical protein